jgi:nucleoid-associated protein YgaU
MRPPQFDWVGLDEFDLPPQAATCAAPARAALVPPVRRAASTGTRGLRRLLPGIATLAVVVGVWFGAGSLVGLRPAPAAGQAVAGTSLVAGESYVAQPGDTLWSIALRFGPIAAQLAAELHGSALQPGDRLVLP